MMSWCPPHGRFGLADACCTTAWSRLIWNGYQLACRGSIGMQTRHVNRPLRDFDERDDDGAPSKPLAERMAFLAHGLYRLFRQGCPILGGHILPFAQPKQRVQRHCGHFLARSAFLCLGPAFLSLGPSEKTVERDYKCGQLD